MHGFAFSLSGRREAYQPTSASKRRGQLKSRRRKFWRKQ
ncbi:MAG: hypothetical protein OJF60_000166 [Burkholderiaceae bacterium]|nr:MAG: hypothetical protein OJF60_000166 [Burkholderiaceae bacterium]